MAGVGAICKVGEGWVSEEARALDVLELRL